MISPKFASKYCIEPDSSSISISVAILDLIRRCERKFNWIPYFEHIDSGRRNNNSSWILSALKVAICIDRSEFTITDEATLSILRRRDPSRWEKISTQSILPNAIDACNAIIHSTTDWINPQKKIKAIAGLKIKKARSASSDRATLFRGSCTQGPKYADVPRTGSEKIGNLCAFKFAESRTPSMKKQEKLSVKTTEMLTRPTDDLGDILMIGALIAKIERSNAKNLWNYDARDVIIAALSEMRFVHVNHFFYVPPPLEICQNADDEYMIRQLVRFCGGAPIPPTIGVCKLSPFSKIVNDAFVVADMKKKEKRKTTVPDITHHTGL
jgi:hypothetical protein